MYIVLHLWHWRITHPQTRESYITRNPMSEADARQMDLNAQRIDGSYQLRVVLGPSLPEVPKQID